MRINEIKLLQVGSVIKDLGYNRMMVIIAIYEGEYTVFFMGEDVARIALLNDNEMRVTRFALEIP